MRLDRGVLTRVRSLGDGKPATSGGTTKIGITKGGERREARRKEWRGEERHGGGGARPDTTSVVRFLRNAPRGTFCPANSLSRSVTLFGRFCAGATAVR